VIDFRYHLVSIVAVFLALAIGIVLGSTELQGNTIDVLRSSSNSLKNQLDQTQAERNSAQAELSTNQHTNLTFLTTAEPRLLANELPADRIVLITEPGASSTVISGVKQAAADARLESQLSTPGGVVPVPGAAFPPGADVGREDAEGGRGVARHLDAGRRRAHRAVPPFSRSTWSRNAPSWSAQNACTWSSQDARPVNGSWRSA